MRKISRIPAAIENVPNVVKKEMNAAPVSSAASMASCFTVCTSRPNLSATGWRLATTSSVSAAPSVAPPRFDTRMARISPGWPKSFCASSSGTSMAAPAVAAPS